jgi:two-component system sensor histidine kinase/response regulator
MLRLKRLLNEQDEINQQHEEFIASLTHDLRTPLIAAEHMLHLLRRGTLGRTLPEMRDSLEQLVQSNHTLLDMVDTLLEIYQYEAGSKVLFFNRVNLWEISGSVVRELLPLAERKGLNLSLILGNGIQGSAVQLQGDRLELRRLLTNLIGNTIRYTDVGGIIVRLYLDPYSLSSDCEIVLEVEDTGIGIAPEEQEFLFERFRQGSQQRRGNGLGLYLSRRIVESHQGTISLRSEVGRGSLFTVSFPTAPQI